MTDDEIRDTTGDLADHAEYQLTITDVAMTPAQLQEWKEPGKWRFKFFGPWGLF